MGVVKNVHQARPEGTREKRPAQQRAERYGKGPESRGQRTGSFVTVVVEGVGGFGMSWRGERLGEERRVRKRLKEERECDVSKGVVRGKRRMNGCGREPAHGWRYVPPRTLKAL